jgi:hypothetical protein
MTLAFQFQNHPAPHNFILDLKKSVSKLGVGGLKTHAHSLEAEEASL